MASQERYIVWLDAGGRTRATIPRADPDNGAIMAALQNHSNAAVINWFEGVRNPLANTPVAAIFADTVDLARLIFMDAGGNQGTIALPAPKSNIFLADTITVDASAIADIIAAAVGHFQTGAGLPVTTFVAGVRNQRSSGA